MLPLALAEIVDDDVDLNGRWRGRYGPHGDEVVAIVHDGPDVVAKKVTGDANVPAGEVTFRARLEGWGGAGEGRVAERGFVDARFVPGWFSILGRDKVSFEWFGIARVVLRRA